MTRHERLVENYEDAYFALLMEEVAQQEGERLEKRNLELQADPAAAVPEDINQRCLRTIDRCFAKQRHKAAWRTTKRVLNRAAVAAVILMLMFTTALAVSADLRSATANLLIVTTEQYTRLDMGEASGTSSQANKDKIDSSQYFSRLEIGWLPDGFDYYTGKYNQWAEFQNDKDMRIGIDFYDKATYLNIDTENADRVENITINGNEGLLVQKDGRIQLVWGDLEKHIFVSIGGSVGMTTEDIIKVAENILIS